MALSLSWACFGRFPQTEKPQNQTKIVSSTCLNSFDGFIWGTVYHACSIAIASKAWTSDRMSVQRKKRIERIDWRLQVHVHVLYHRVSRWSEEGWGRIRIEGEDRRLTKLSAGHLIRAFAQLIDALPLCEYCTLEGTIEPNIVMFRAWPNSSLAKRCRKSILYWFWQHSVLLGRIVHTVWNTSIVILLYLIVCFRMRLL